MMKQSDKSFDEELAYLQFQFSSDPDETLFADAVRMLASARQFADISQQITQYLRTIAFLSRRRLKNQRLSSFPTERSLAEWRKRLNLDTDNAVNRLVDVIFNRALNGLTYTVNALMGYVNVPPDVRKAVRASRILL